MPDIFDTLDPNYISDSIKESPVDDLDLDDNVITQVVAFVESKFEDAKRGKTITEQTALDNYRQWRGEYSSAEASQLGKLRERDPFASQIFVKITKTKVQAAYGQIMEILEAGGSLPLSVKPTPVPDNVPTYIHIDNTGIPSVSITDEEGTSNTGPLDIYGYDGDGQEIEAGATSKSLLEKALGKVFGEKSKIVSGLSPDKKAVPQLSYAEMAAFYNERIMKDQLEETLFRDSVKRAAYESCMLGTGVLKGPVNYKETYPHWKKLEDGSVVYDPKTKVVPKFSFVSFWNFYPDPESSSIADCSYTIERHLMAPHQIKKLINIPFFKEDALKDLIKEGPKERELEQWESYIKDNNGTLYSNSDRYVVKEYWGYLDKELVDLLELDYDQYDSISNCVQVNLWVSQGKLLRAVANPYNPQVIPYYTLPYELHPYQIWGIAIPENMRDTQALMNGHMRLAIDNLRYAGNVILEVNENQLVPGQKVELYPGKIFRKQGGAPGQSIYGIKFPDTSQSHMMMFDKCRQISDEQTGLPSYAHGSTGIMSTGRTASGMSMLMGAAQVNIKTVIKNYDLAFEALGRNLYAWNMQFNYKKDGNPNGFELASDVKIVAKGTSSLMQKEVLTQRLMMLVQTFANPLMAPIFNFAEAGRDIVKAMDLDPEKYINSPEAAMLYAQTVGSMGQAGQPAGTNPNAPTADGTIAQGNTPVPGEEQFSGNMQDVSQGDMTQQPV